MKYNSDIGGMEWGTPQGTQYFKELTPGEEPDKKNKKKRDVKEECPTYMDYCNPDHPVAGIVPLDDGDINELEHTVDTFTWEMALDLGLYDEDELDAGTEVDITEVLSVQGRMKRRFSARKNKQKLRVARGIALRRGSTPDRLKKRAVRGARGLVYKRLLKGRDRSAMPPAEKARLERLLKLYAPLVDRLSVRLLPNMRKMEISRMKSRRAKGPQRSKVYKAAKPIQKPQKAKRFKIKKR